MPLVLSRLNHGFLIADVSANRIVDKPEQSLIRPPEGPPVTSSNFREEVLPKGTTGREDANEVKTHNGQSVP